MTVDELLAPARVTLPHRPSPSQALCAQAEGALLIDIRGDDQRREDGLRESQHSGPGAAGAAVR